MNGQNAVNALLAIVGGVIGLAIVSVLVSPRAQTPAVFTSGGQALANVVTAAVSPVTGQAANVGSSGSGGTGFLPFSINPSTLFNMFGG